LEKWLMDPKVLRVHIEQEEVMVQGNMAATLDFPAGDDLAFGSMAPVLDGGTNKRRQIDNQGSN
jgi:hypothetical protein